MFGPVAESIETERLLLEPLTVAHAEEMVHVLDDWGLHTFTGGEPATLAELRSRYNRLVSGPAPYHQEGWLNWIVHLRPPPPAGPPRAGPDDEERAVGPAVGTVEATVHPGPWAALAWVIGTEWQGRGIATEAARGLIGWLTAHSVTDLRANIHPGNQASAAVARKLGLSPTGRCIGGEIVWRS
ncbi:GNAT family N-acetyltransferase [Actinomadura scrupuli]|uniref:GNAT family N-acetyltransferase n=1 Tax=Actinomadura scrupuli TaxID=559629 RepID=UPI003D98C303